MENEKKTASKDTAQLNTEPSPPELSAPEPSKPKRSRRPAAGKSKTKPPEPAEPKVVEAAKFKLPAWILPDPEPGKPKQSRRPAAGNRKAKPPESAGQEGTDAVKIGLPVGIQPETAQAGQKKSESTGPEASPEASKEQPSEPVKPKRSRRPDAGKNRTKSSEPAGPLRVEVAKIRLPAWILPEEIDTDEPEAEQEDPEPTGPEVSPEASKEQPSEPAKPKRRRRAAAGNRKAKLPEPADQDGLDTVKIDLPALVQPEASQPEQLNPEPSGQDSSAQEPSKPKRRRRPAGRKRKKKSPESESVEGIDAPESLPVPVPDSWSIDEFNVPPEEGRVRFHDLSLPAPLMHGIFDLNFTYCTPIQAEILPSTLTGRDAFGKAQTGTGKTAAFLITVITQMMNNPIPGQRKPGTPRVLVLAPTRELVIQISEEARQLGKYCGLTVIAVFGGMDYDKQRRQLAGTPVDIMVATPGRLLDFQHRRDLYLNKVETLIIDEADRMLDMGFIPDVRKIIYSTPAKESRQTLLFSATLTEAITRLAESWTRNPVTVEIEPEMIAVDTVDQVVYIVTAKEKFALLYNVIEKQKLERVLIFCNRKDQVVRLSEMLARHGITCSMLSGDVPQQKRVQRLEAFKAGKIRVIVATDVVARGIHIEGMDHVINFKLPHDPEDYVHRIGRTGRAGAAGTSISFADDDDAFYLPDIEAFIGRKLPCIVPDDAWLVMPEPLYAYKPDKSRPPRKPGGDRSGGGRSGNKSPSRRRPGRS
ncbi:MAG: DEAD/DEAH box helicase [Desulfosalsimonadaceae bacterium]